jgi:hypothetical protein
MPWLIKFQLYEQSSKSVVTTETRAKKLGEDIDILLIKIDVSHNKKEKY